MNAKRPYIPDGCDQQGRVIPTHQQQENPLRGAMSDRLLNDLNARNRQRIEAVKAAQKQATIDGVAE